MMLVKITPVSIPYAGRSKIRYFVEAKRRDGTGWDDVGNYEHEHEAIAAKAAWIKQKIEVEKTDRVCLKCGKPTPPSDATWIKTGDWLTMADFAANKQNLRQEFLVCNDCQTKILKFILTSE